MRALLLAAGLTIITAGCDGDPVCDPCATQAVIFGTVSNDQGEPVAGVQMNFEVYRQTCGTEVRAGERATSDASGRYRAHIHSLWTPFVGHCFVIRTNPDNQPGFPTLDFEFQGELAFHTRLRDSVRYDVVLPTASNGILPDLSRR